MDAPPCGEGPHPVSDAVSSACSGLGGGLLTCYPPFRHWIPEDPVRLACLIHAASVHSEPGSNSPSLKSPIAGALPRAPPVDSLLSFFNLKDSLEGSRRARRRGTFLNQILLAHIALLGFQRAGGRSVRSALSRPLIYTAFPPLQADAAFFSGKGNFRPSRQGQPAFTKGSFHSHFARNSMNSSDCLPLQMVAHPLEARQVFKLHRLFTMSNQLVNFFWIFRHFT